MSLLDDEEDILKESDGIVEKTILTEFMEKYMGGSSNLPVFYEYYFEQIEGFGGMVMTNSIISKPILHNNIIYPINGHKIMIKGFKNKKFEYKHLPIRVGNLNDNRLEILLLDCHPELLKEGIPGVKLIRQFKDDWRANDQHTLKKISGEIIDRQNI